jgi:hypothetical protein
MRGDEIGIVGVHANYPSDGWNLRVEVVVAADGAVGVRRFSFESVGGRPQRLPSRIDLGEVNEHIDHLLNESSLRLLLPPALRRKLNRRRPGQRGRPDMFYAERVAEFVDALGHEPRTPIRWLVDNVESPTDGSADAKAWRRWLAEAERRDLLADRPAAEEGRTGGTMTDKCRRLLDGEED